MLRELKATVLPTTPALDVCKSETTIDTEDAIPLTIRRGRERELSSYCPAPHDVSVSENRKDTPIDEGKSCDSNVNAPEPKGSTTRLKSIVLSKTARGL